MVSLIALCQRVELHCRVFLADRPDSAWSTGFYAGIGTLHDWIARRSEAWVLISSIVVIQLSDGFVGHYPRFDPCGESD